MAREEVSEVKQKETKRRNTDGYDSGALFPGTEEESPGAVWILSATKASGVRGGGAAGCSALSGSHSRASPGGSEAERASSALAGGGGRGGEGGQT